MNDILIPYVTRGDLRAYERQRDNQTFYIVADRLRNQHTELSEIEYFILEFLKEARTLKDLTIALQSSFQAKYTDEQIVVFLERLFLMNLVSKPGFGSGALLYRQKQNEDRANFKSSLLGWLSIKLPGFYPQPMLKMLEPIGSLFFNRFSLFLVTVLALITSVYAVLNFPALYLKIPAAAELLAVDHLFMVVCAYVLVKVLHELGHGLACQRVGHECSEMGLIFLVFMPCMFCDVSDVWTQENKWKRIFVSAAGVIVETAIAVICFWGWVQMNDGKMATLFFSIMLITSLNTLLVNGNPLMRFDGYYVLSDFLEIPNLSSRASAVLRDYFGSLVYIADERLDEDKPNVQLAYAVAAVGYRCFILFSISLAIWYFFDNYGLKTFGSMALLLLAITTVLPLLNGVKMMWKTGVKKLNVPGLAFLALSGILIGFVFVVPFKYRVWGVANFQLAQRQQIFAPSNGYYFPTIDDGAAVAEDDVLGHIEIKENPTNRALLQGEFDEVEALLAAAEMYEQSTIIASEQEFLNERKTSLLEKLEEFERKERELELRSKSDGRFVAARHGVSKVSSLRPKHINVYDNANRGAYVKRGTLLGYVGKADDFEGRFEVHENEVDLLSVGDLVKVRDHSFNYTGTIEKISLENTVTSESNQNQSPASFDDSKNVYEVTFRLNQNSHLEDLPIAAKRKVVVLGKTTNLMDYVLRKMNINWW